MGAANIQAKIKSGLAKAINKTGSSTSDLIYLIVNNVSGGTTPLNTPNVIESKTLLVNAIFKSFDVKQFAGELQAGDRMLVSDNDVAVTVGDVIEEGSTRYIIVAQDVKAPTSDTLVYISQVRVQECR